MLSSHTPDTNYHLLSTSTLTRVFSAVNLVELSRVKTACFLHMLIFSVINYPTARKGGINFTIANAEPLPYPFVNDVHFLSKKIDTNCHWRNESGFTAPSCKLNYTSAPQSFIYEKCTILWLSMSVENNLFRLNSP